MAVQPLGGALGAVSVTPLSGAASIVWRVTGRLMGEYQCSVSNVRGNASSQILTVEGMNVRDVWGCGVQNTRSRVISVAA